LNYPNFEISFLCIVSIAVVVPVIPVALIIFDMF
jgi:hypothetical protein